MIFTAPEVDVTNEILGLPAGENSKPNAAYKPRPAAPYFFRNNSLTIHPNDGFALNFKVCCE
jgi:hypothetical protein